MQLTTTFRISPISLLFWGACFSPDYPTGLACGPDDFCPSGQLCSAAKVCESTGGQPGGADADLSPDALSGLGDLQSIDIGADLSLTLAQTHTFVVNGMYEGGTQEENNALVIWKSSDTSTAFVDFQGVAHPQTTGAVTITADLNGRVATVTLTVTP